MLGTEEPRLPVQHTKSYTDQGSGVSAGGSLGESHAPQLRIEKPVPIAVT